MNCLPLSASLFSRLRLSLPLILSLFALACRNPQERPSFNQATLDRIYSGQDDHTPTAYRLDSQPFSPTLPYLFDQARIVVMPENTVGAPPAGIQAANYAFSAIDRFGRLFHFDTQARWWMAEGETLPAPLPAGEWTATWNEAAGALELLISAPWNGEHTPALLRWRAGHWRRLALGRPPQARNGAARLFLAASQRWLLLGGKAGAQPLADGWTIEGGAWKKWAGADPALADSAPPLGQTLELIDGPADAAPILLTDAGAIWIWHGSAWKEAGTVKIENLDLARYVPSLGQVLFVWGRGRGQDQILWQTPQQIENGSTSMPELIPQTAQVRLNDRDEGLWKAWGRARTEKDRIGQTHDVLEAGFAGQGEPAIQIGGSGGEDKIVRRGAISMVELPPSLDTLRFEAAAWVPALGGIVAPSVCGIGINARRDPFFPPEAWDAGTTSATQPMIDVIEHNARFWIFRRKSLDWLKPPYEIHPGIDYASSYQTLDGRRRCLAWTNPEPGMLRYDFHEFHDKKVLWTNSPRLTLRQAPQLALAPGDEIFLSDPVVWGDPAEIVVVGWCGRMGKRMTFPHAPQGLNNEAYDQVPGRGFMARISALEPSEWKISTLPIPFCQGAQLVAAPARGSLYLLGGKTFELTDYDRQKLFFSRSQNDVWHWDSESWRKIVVESGIQPRMKAISHVVYNPAASQLLCLTPLALYSFDTDVWHGLWQRPKERDGEPKSEDVALYVHPLSHLVLGAWFVPQAVLRVWGGHGWIPVRSSAALDADAGSSETQAQREAGSALPDNSDDLVPSTQPDAFIAVDAEELNAIRMDAPRDRDQDRLLEAAWLTFQPANAGPIPFARRPLEDETATSGTAAAPVSAKAAAVSPTARPLPAATATPGSPEPGTAASATSATRNRTGQLMQQLENLTE